MEPNYKVGQTVRVSFNESEDLIKTPYKARILEIVSEENKFFNKYKVEIVSPDKDAPKYFNTRKFKKSVGDIIEVKDFNLSDL